MLETEALKDAKTGQSFRTRHLHSGHNNKGKWGRGVEEDRSYSSTTAQSRPRRQCKNRNAQTHDTKTTSQRSLQLMRICQWLLSRCRRGTVRRASVKSASRLGRINVFIGINEDDEKCSPPPSLSAKWGGGSSLILRALSSSGEKERWTKVQTGFTRLRFSQNNGSTDHNADCNSRARGHYNQPLTHSCPRSQLSIRLPSQFKWYWLWLKYPSQSHSWPSCISCIILCCSRYFPISC